MGQDPENERANNAFLAQIARLKSDTSTPTGNKLVWGCGCACALIVAIFVAVTLVGLSSGATTDAAKQVDQFKTANEIIANQSSAAPEPLQIIATKFDKLIGEYNSNEVAAARKYVGSRIRNKDYVSSIRQDNEGAYAVLDGAIYAYGSADVLATLHRGDEVQITCDSARKMTFLYLKNCDFEVLHPTSGFDDDVGFRAINFDGDGGAAVALVRRDH